MGISGSFLDQCNNTAIIDSNVIGNKAYGSVGAL